VDWLLIIETESVLQMKLTGKDNNNRYRMKNSTIKDIMMLGAFAGFAYYITRYYRQKKQKERELRETLHFQLF
jgi:hypothetical protein